MNNELLKTRPYSGSGGCVYAPDIALPARFSISIFWLGLAFHTLYTPVPLCVFNYLFKPWPKTHQRLDGLQAINMVLYCQYLHIFCLLGIVSFWVDKTDPFLPSTTHQIIQLYDAATSFGAPAETYLRSLILFISIIGSIWHVLDGFYWVSWQVGKQRWKSQNR